MEAPLPAVPEGSRRTIRRAVTLACEVISERSDEPVRFRATELSVDGIWLATASPMRAGSIVVVCFSLDDGWAEELVLFASVARVSTARGAKDDTPGVGMGLELLDATAQEERRLERWLATHRGPVPRRRRPVSERLRETTERMAKSTPDARLAGCWR
ncbi:MAG: hypothetical protein EXR75_03390 [Myxococcales bacterium]|nr:hypothetical protein [Myxococcales bacterium]